MKKAHLTFIDFASGAAAIGALYAVDAPGYAYAIMLVFAAVQRFCAYQLGKADAARAFLRVIR